MSEPGGTEHVRESSLRSKSKIAGVLYLISVLMAGSAEAFVHGKMLFVLGLIAVSCYVAVTLLVYGIFKPVQRRLAALALSFNLVGLALEAVQLNPNGVDIALVFHGFYCLLIGYLAFCSTFTPRILGILMIVGSMGWLSFLSPSVAKYLSPFNLAFGLLCEGALMLWLLAVGVDAGRRKQQAEAEDTHKSARLRSGC